MAEVGARRAVSSLQSVDGGTLFFQGAEARLWSQWSEAAGRYVLVKERVRKGYRHPALDERLTRQRFTQEVRCLVRCQRAGVRVPQVFFVDPVDAVFHMEHISGHTVREILSGEGTLRKEDGLSPLRQRGTQAVDQDGEERKEHEQEEQEEEEAEATEKHGADGDRTGRWVQPSDALCREVVEQIGEAMARMHDADIVHGDPTTSNFVVAHGTGAVKLVVIDFGLSTVTALAEDKAVDLYVLERAFLSTHPNSEHWVQAVLERYGERSRNATAVLARLEAVRLRGRKRDLFG